MKMGKARDLYNLLLLINNLPKGEMSIMWLKT